MYRLIIDSVPKEQLNDLLLHENKDGLRPLEYAMHLGISCLTSEILQTPPTYVTEEIPRGTGVTKRIDVTDYEVSAGRTLMSPLILLAVFDRNMINEESFQKLFYSDVFQK